MKLQDKLNEMKARFESGLPAEIKARMHQATDDMMQSGIIDNVQKNEEGTYKLCPSGNHERMA